MSSFQASVITALLRRMGGTQYLEWDEFQGSEHPHFATDGEYLIVCPAENEEARPGPSRDSEMNSQQDVSASPPNGSLHLTLADYINR